MRNKGARTTLAWLCLLTVPLAAAGAESHEEGAAPMAPSFRPIEIYACNFDEGQGMAELMEVTAAWNAWMDEQGRSEHWASLPIPHHTAPAAGSLEAPR